MFFVRVVIESFVQFINIMWGVEETPNLMTTVYSVFGLALQPNGTNNEMEQNKSEEKEKKNRRNNWHKFYLDRI